jgi:hypothetical protein
MISFCYQLFSSSGIPPIFGGEKGNFSRPHIYAVHTYEQDAAGEQDGDFGSKSNR